jgi:hypothetical protein
MVEHLTENQGVKSSILFVDKAWLAQLVEQRTFNPVVIGSIPIPGIFRLCGGMVYTLDSKSSASAYGFKSHHSHIIIVMLCVRI